MAEELRLRASELLAAAARLACLNCGATLGGPFCSECGQRDIPPYPSTRELAVDAISEFSGWDGRLASTIRALVRRPGMLTLEFLEGRRVRYISPLRLYLTASVIYFLLAAAAPTARRGERAAGSGLQVSTTYTKKASGPQRVADATRESLDRQDLTPAEKDSALAAITRAPAAMQPFLRRAVLDPAGFKRGILENTPRMLFILLPVFAGIISLFYRHRKYPEHLYFAIHLYAFIFLALAAMELTKFSQLPALVAIASTLALLAIPVYATLAFRHVYGGSVLRTVIKELAIGVIYGCVAVVAFVAMLYWVSIAG